MGVKRTAPVFPSVVAEQLLVLLADIRPSVLKLGMLATDDIVLSVAGALDRCAVPRVVDPVFRASDGSFLLEQRALGNLVERLINGAALVTPNLPECEALTGETDPERAARAFLELGAEAVLVKGGHAEGPADDFLATRAGDGLWLRGPRLDAGRVHGTGCALSAAITARLARGEPLEAAARGAKEWVARAIAGAQALGKGARCSRSPGALVPAERGQDRRQEQQHGGHRDDQPRQGGDRERLQHVRARADAQRERQQRERRGDPRHHDRAQPRAPGLEQRRAGRQPCARFAPLRTGRTPPSRR